MSYVSTFNALQVSNVTPGQKLVLAAIASFERAGKAWPSVATIAKRASMAVRTVQRHLAALVNLGYITRTYRAGRSAITRLFIGETPAKLAPPPPPNWHPEPAIESVNTTTAPPPEPLPDTAGAAIVVFEIPQAEQPKTAIEPSQDVGGTVASPDPVQGVIAPSDPLAGVPETLMKDWADVRKHKKKTPKPVKTEAQILAQEAAKAGLSVADVILLCVLRGWSRFEASWIQHVPPQTAPGAPAAPALWTPEQYTPASKDLVAKMKAEIAAMKQRWKEEPLRPMRQ